ncbi:hypothetical protein ABT294_08580 [Nonomuraea sp. NPDC000554]|uniref:hypothetical protein n=1 Tax=Nonomuraea sp. NPDC000554 TaxID=3154259 RepID=UPI003333D5BD
MGVSKQMTSTLACVVVLAALGPGIAGYLSGRLEAVKSAERSLRSLEVRLHEMEAREARPVSFPTACLPQPAQPPQPAEPAESQMRLPTAAALPDGHPRRKRAHRADEQFPWLSEPFDEPETAN